MSQYITWDWAPLSWSQHGTALAEFTPMEMETARQCCTSEQEAALQLKKKKTQIGKEGAECTVALTMGQAIHPQVVLLSLVSVVVEKKLEKLCFERCAE